MTTKLPIWFRPYVWIPVVGLLYAVIPLCIWNFSPHMLTHSMPYFLVGGSRWGGANVFAFTKLAYWISMVGGAVAISRVSIAKEADTTFETFRFIIKYFGWHCLAAVALVLAWKVRGGVTNVGDLWSLTAYFFAATVVVVFTSRRLEIMGRESWRMVVCVAIGIMWGFIPIGRG